MPDFQRLIRLTVKHGLANEWLRKPGGTSSDVLVRAYVCCVRQPAQLTNP
jgi:hypothetical protein